ncbi:MAG: DinB family protein [Candidatus Heimdallarchaeota archaeon]|nr:DinB family protein [Candidatus Heimdallarchaeota archaeon]
MISELLKQAILRHLGETRYFISNLTGGRTVANLFKDNVVEPDQILFEMPAKDGRSLGQVLLHLIRSLEFYSRGVVTNMWEPLSYSLVDYPTAPEILLLYDSVVSSITALLNNLTDEMLTQIVDKFNKTATKGEILLEMLEHSIHHRGQISVYFRVLGIKPPEISYIV